ncbi:MAG TPA: tRNA uridine-5-carboxymethylaminomethyl(34) synthesis GTPase MnmE [Bacteroidota bacterium]|nr:tRNA uridine-5-carboxymethylaminomethyl(34) synthesis GTPase MnmE [Bacteroidota bacterium]
MLREAKDTIAAIATPIGEGGIAVIRVSGSLAIEAADRVFRGSRPLSSAKSHTIHYGKIITDRGDLVDDVLVSVFKNPHSYTGEDSVEISCHGSYYVSQKILETVIASGARLADPGEFTQRAFLNGRMDLMQAEAVADLIHSKTALAHKASMEQLNGRLSAEINSIRQNLIELCSLLELELDFAEEGIKLSDKEKILSVFDETITDIKKLIDSYRFGKLVRDGVKVVLAGSPNVGKSSLLNALLQENRAIVSDIPGTTRDVIEESIAINGVVFRFVDTAGLRETSDHVEKEGVRRSNSQIESSDIILLVVDAADPSLAEKGASKVFDVVESYGEKVLIVYNKIDLLPNGHNIKWPYNSAAVLISCLTKEGIEELTNKIYQRAVTNFDSNSSSVKIQSSRHQELLRKCLSSVVSAKSSQVDDLGGELVAVDLRIALDYLGEIVGLTTSDDVLNSIFSNFCIGK